MKSNIWTRMGALFAVVLTWTDLDRDRLEQAGLQILAAGGDREDVQEALEIVYEDLIDWTEVLPKPWGAVVESGENFLISVLARRTAKRLVKVWRKLNADERTAWVLRVAQGAAAGAA